MNHNVFDEYMSDLDTCLEEVVNQKERVYKIGKLIDEAIRNNHSIFILGNGGSAATSSHFAQDIRSLRSEAKVRSLVDNIPIITALSNDYGYDIVFCEQLKWVLDKDDIVICISASGVSENVIKAARYAQYCGAVVIGFIGFGGGKLQELTTERVVLSSTDYGCVEDVHLMLAHIISRMLKEEK